MEKIKDIFLSKILYMITIVGLIAVSGILITLPKCVGWFLKETVFYATVEHWKIMTLLYVTGIPAWFIIWFTRGLAQNIISRNPFSKKSTLYLKGISICAFSVFICYLFACFKIKATVAFVVITIGAFVVALIAAILYRLVDLAIEIKEENELTI